MTINLWGLGRMKTHSFLGYWGQFFFTKLNVSILTIRFQLIQILWNLVPRATRNSQMHKLLMLLKNEGKELHNEARFVQSHMTNTSSHVQVLMKVQWIVGLKTQTSTQVWVWSKSKSGHIRREGENYVLYNVLNRGFYGKNILRFAIDQKWPKRNESAIVVARDFFFLPSNDMWISFL